MTSSPLSVHVDPRHHDSNTELWSALERVFPVHFSAERDTACIGTIGVAGEPSPHDAPTLSLPLRDTEPGGGPRGVVKVRTTSAVPDQALAGMDLIDSGPLADALDLEGDESVLAETDAGPVWTMTRSGQAPSFRSVRPLPAIGSGSDLRSHATLGDFLGLVPLIQALRSWLGDKGWTEPPLMATFLFDDINLHSNRYGYIPFDQLVEDSREAGYHTVMATIPLDAWYARGGARKLFADRDVLSLVFHGNNHTNYELASPETDDDALAMMAQGLRRIEAFERRTGLAVDRVMTPPHGRCSTRIATALFRLGFRGLCIDDVVSWSSEPDPDPLLHGWFPTDLVAGGLPVIPRTLFEHDPRELAFRAFLRHPLVIYGHHQDVADGLGVLRSFADLVNGFGDVRWCALDEMLKASVATRVDGSTMRARAYSSAVDLVVPEGVEEVVLETPAVAGVGDGTQVSVEVGATDFAIDARNRVFSEAAEVEAGVVRATLSSTMPVDPRGVAAPPLRPWPLARRVLTETRDRALPLAPTVLSRFQRSS